MNRPDTPASAVVQAVDRHNAEHYRWGEQCDGWHLLRNSRLSVIEEEVPAGAGEVRHRHSRAQQFFYILHGEAQIELEGQTIRLGPGQGLAVGAGQAHCFHNPGPQPVRFLVISEPAAQGDRSPAPLETTG